MIYEEILNQEETTEEVPGEETKETTEEEGTEETAEETEKEL